MADLLDRDYFAEACRVLMEDHRIKAAAFGITEGGDEVAQGDSIGAQKVRALIRPSKWRGGECNSDPKQQRKGNKDLKGMPRESDLQAWRVSGVIDIDCCQGCATAR